MQIEVSMRDFENTSVLVEVGGQTTCLEAVSSSGLCPRDGSLYHAWDGSGKIVDKELASDFSHIYIAPFATVRNVKCDELKLKKKFGVSKLDDCSIFTPGLKIGDYATVVISESWNSRGFVSCSAYKVNLIGNPYNVGDLIYMIPRDSSGKSHQQLYNPVTGKFDLKFQLDWKTRKYSNYDGVNCIIKVTSIKPLKCELLVNETWKIPRNRWKIIRNTKRKDPLGLTRSPVKPLSLRSTYCPLTGRRLHT